VPLLTELLTRAGLDASFDGAEVAIHAITADSREVVPGTLFVALRGVRGDGAQFIPDALQRGAAAIVLDHDHALGMATTAPLIRVADGRAAIAALAGALYPQQPEHLYAITGTDGKTSTADFVRQLAGSLGHQAASIGTLGLRSPVAALNAQFPAINTSPEPVLLRRILSSLADAGVTHAAVEASSHGLDQKRLDGLRFTAAAFTNLTRDHLDYHGTVEAYASAKARLFAQVLPATARAVLNADDAQYGALKAICDGRGLLTRSFGQHAEADYRIDRIRQHGGGLDAALTLRGKAFDVSLPLYGAFQLFNVLAALALLEPADLSHAVALLPRLQGVPGRLEKVTEKNGAPVFVDYAHTPAALENILKTLRPHTAGKLHVVFGAGGDRDMGKRPEMGRAAQQYADAVIVTDDNPRSENPATIRAAILAAAPAATELGDRAMAIRTALSNLKPGDVLVVAGKGHETTQTVGEQVIHFSDAEHIREAV
jgi:UDP-N-acetylmuramoyl-L-alanyl-D-glutamate--2,6-diaminopimelate ligase